MTRVFADTSFYLALISKRDKWHVAADTLFGQLDAMIVTAEYILLELGALMSRGSARLVFIEFVERVRSDPFTQVLSASPHLFEGGLGLFAARNDKEWSLTDCISFFVMQQEGMKDSLTCDQHFVQAGFRVLLES